jgi:acetyltransferase/esterase
MSTLEVPGARLYHRVTGTGPLIVLVSGANGEADMWQPFVDGIKDHYRVVAYDRRGFSRSELTGPQDWDHRLETDADDVGRLIEHLGDGPVTVVGHSSGAIVALKALLRHPDKIRTLIPHEPPAISWLPDEDEWRSFFADCHRIYRESGIPPAMRKFVHGTADPEEVEFMESVMSKNDDGDDAFTEKNAVYWWEHEFLQYPPADLDLDELAEHRDTIVPTGGTTSRGHVANRAVAALAERLGRDLPAFPGGHVGFVTHPKEFTAKFLETFPPDPA